MAIAYLYIQSLTKYTYYELNIVLDTGCTDGTRTDKGFALLELMLQWERQIEKNRQTKCMSGCDKSYEKQGRVR